MKTHRLISALASFCILAASVQAAEVYDFDPVHSAIGFKIRHLFSDVTGRFNEFSGKVSVDPDKPENSSVEVTIQTKSIDTANTKRDEHLRSGDFFDATKNPTITFKSKKVIKIDEKSATVTGDLTMHGVTKEVPLTVNFLGKGKGMKGETVTGWSASTGLNRLDYGLKYNSLIEGTSVLGDDVKIDIQVEAHEAK